MEDNDNRSEDMLAAFTKVRDKKMLDENQAIKLQAFFSELIPEAVEQDTEKEMQAGELFSQLLASSISQSINDFHKEERPEPDNSSCKALQASSLIGRNVLIKDGRFYLEEGSSIVGRLSIKEHAHQVLVYIENESQQIVRIIPLGDNVFGEITFKWNGVTRTGDNAPEGDYRFIVSSICNSRVQEQNVYTYNKVVKVTFEIVSQDMLLHFENDYSIKLKDVIEIIK